MASTIAIMDSLIDHLKQHFNPDVAVAYYPEKPESYRLNHPNGAVLLSYASANYPKYNDINAVIQPRELGFNLSIVNRQLYGRTGAIEVLDKLINVVAGFSPVHCDKPLRPVKDYFVRHEAGLWFYGLDVATETVQVQHTDYNPIMDI